MSANLEQVELLFPQGKDVTVGGKTFNLKPFGFGKYPKLLKLMKDIKVGDELPADASKVMEALPKVDIGTLMAANADKVIEICALALGQPVAFFDTVLPDEGVALCQAIIEVNVDFFVRRLQPVLLTAVAGLSASIGGVLSQASSQPATA